MGWLFAVALGLHRGSRRAVLVSLLPIALGHAAAVLAAVLAFAAMGEVVEPALLRRGAGLVLIGWAVWHARYGHRQRVRFGMRVGLAGLAAWSFLMATAHGAGLMLLPLLDVLGSAAGMHGRDRHGLAGSLDQALAATAVHSLAMLAMTATMAVLVHDWLGVAVLRRGWVNLDLVWTAALGLVGLLLLFAP